MADCTYLHKKHPVGWSLPEDQYIPDSEVLFRLSENVCGSLQAHLQAVLLPVRGLRSKGRQEYFRYLQIRSECRIRHAEYHKLQFLRVRYLMYVHLIL